MVRFSKFVQGTKSVKGPNHCDTKDDRYCKECDHEFDRPAEYRRHRNETLRHNPKGARKYKCDICPKAFTQRYNLRNHRRTHTGETFLCNLPLDKEHSELCQRRYKDKSNLRTHIKRDHLKVQHPVPAWLEEAVEERVKGLCKKQRKTRATKKRKSPPSETSTPSDSPPTYADQRSDWFSPQVFDAQTMLPIQSDPVVPKDQLAVGKSGELDLQLLNFLNSDYSRSESALLSGYASTAPAHAHDDITQLLWPSVTVSNDHMSFAPQIPQYPLFQETSPMPLGPLGYPDDFSVTPQISSFPPVNSGPVTASFAMNQPISFNGHLDTSGMGRSPVDFFDDMGNIQIHEDTPPGLYGSNNGYWVQPNSFGSGLYLPTF
ncbi:hypothetical protein NP233_g8315 [Leucocoprinus birnbaumii]|uniref:C2H2-type domain-containing protein n=1 Tax=Leucocoprinus birnbaumii TaxID=56174 RepID=A0AAD5VMS3_9AGAR|nr:hypothetical protein NP233_g8315 [Leucocoprinus birnbaumii]